MGIEQYLRKVENKSEQNQIRNIDFIYTINLDKCPDKLEYCKQQLAPYQIHLHRFPAIYGKSLPAEAFDEVGVKLDPNTRPDWTQMRCLNDSPLISQWNKKYVHRMTTKGQVGCFLSHLSILIDAYESGYQRIWVQEDDFFVKEDPHCLGDYIDRLDSLVGREGWDILYTDDFDHHPKFEGKVYMRPDILTNYENAPFHEQVGEDFYRIGGRCYAYSMIVNRCGIERIINFYKNFSLFNGYDQELSLIPGIRLYNLIPSPISCGISPSPSETL